MATATEPAERVEAMEENNLVEHEDPGDFDEDLRLAQIQRDAKLEALARRDKPKFGSRSKKGRSSPNNI